MKAGDLVLVRSHPFSRWELSIYAYASPYHFVDGNVRHMCINGTDWTECIPYEGNEALLGSQGTCPSGFVSGQPVAVRDSEEEEWKIRYFSHVMKKLPDSFGQGGSIRYVCFRTLPVGSDSPLLDRGEEEVWKICAPLENAFKGFGRIYERRSGGSPADAVERVEGGNAIERRKKGIGE